MSESEDKNQSTARVSTSRRNWPVLAFLIAEGYAVFIIVTGYFPTGNGNGWYRTDKPNLYWSGVIFVVVLGIICLLGPAISSVKNRNRG